MNSPSSENSTICLVDGVGLAPGEAVERRVEVDVLLSRQVGLEADPQLDHRGHAPPHDDLALRRPEDAGHDAQQGALPGAVRPDQAEALALAHLQIDPPEGPERLEPLPVPRMKHADEPDLDVVGRVVTEHEGLRDAPELDRPRHAYTSSAKPGLNRWKSGIAAEQRGRGPAHQRREDQLLRHPAPEQDVLVGDGEGPQGTQLEEELELRPAPWSRGRGSASSRSSSTSATSVRWAMSRRTRCTLPGRRRDPA